MSEQELPIYLNSHNPFVSNVLRHVIMLGSLIKQDVAVFVDYEVSLSSWQTMTSAVLNLDVQLFKISLTNFLIVLFFEKLSFFKLTPFSVHVMCVYILVMFQLINRLILLKTANIKFYQDRFYSKTFCSILVELIRFIN